MIAPARWPSCSQGWRESRPGPGAPSADWMQRVCQQRVRPSLAAKNWCSPAQRAAPPASTLRATDPLRLRSAAAPPQTWNGLAPTQIPTVADEGGDPGESAAALILAADRLRAAPVAAGLGQQRPALHGNPPRRGPRADPRARSCTLCNGQHPLSVRRRGNPGHCFKSVSRDFPLDQYKKNEMAQTTLPKVVIEFRGTN